MTAIDETRPGGPGKYTRDGSQPDVGQVTRALTLPQLPYADAVHAALDALKFLPDALEAGVRTETPGRQRELFLRLDWLPGHDDLVLPAMAADGLTVMWSHLAGWATRSGDDLLVLDLTELAAPALVADAAMHAALHGLRCACERPDTWGRWDHALELDIALVNYAEREAR